MKPAGEMHVHLRIHHWVLWWIGIGAVLGAISLLNIFLRHLTRTQELMILFIGVLNWVLGGMVCWAFDGIRITKPLEAPHPAKEEQPKPDVEWHPASDFLLPGGRKSLLPPKYPPRHSPLERELQSKSQSEKQS